MPLPETKYDVEILFCVSHFDMIIITTVDITVEQKCIIIKTTKFHLRSIIMYSDIVYMTLPRSI